MTRRMKACRVTLNMDIREDDAERLLEAIRMLKWVVNVEAIEASGADWFARDRVRHECEARLHEAIRRIMKGPAMPALPSESGLRPEG